MPKSEIVLYLHQYHLLLLNISTKSDLDTKKVYTKEGNCVSFESLFNTLSSNIQVQNKF